MKPNLHLYVWEDVFCDFTCGIAFALATSPDEAREMIARMEWPDDTPMHPSSDRAFVLGGRRQDVKDALAGDPKVYDTKIAFAVRGGG